MTRLPPALQPLWPAAKVVHRAATRSIGRVVRSTGYGGDDAVPRAACLTSRETARSEPDTVRIHVGGPAEHLDREIPQGNGAHLRFWRDVQQADIPERFVLEVERGRLVGDVAATVTPGGMLDLQTSPYFGIRDWREHPIFLNRRLPPTERVAGTLVSLASPASGRNYYHSLMDTLPRWGVLAEALPGTRPDALVVAGSSRWDARLLSLAGLDDFVRLAPSPRRTYTADRLLVPCLNNQGTMAPRWITRWLRENLPAKDVADKPRRLYVTRGAVPHTRRLVDEAALLPQLERLGFTCIDPGRLDVQEQIDHFAAAEVVVAPHGAALVNLTFAPEGVRVLELFAPRYLNPGYWAITDNLADSTYRHLVAEPLEPDRPERRMNRVQDDVDLSATQVLAAVEELLDA